MLLSLAGRIFIKLSFIFLPIIDQEVFLIDIIVTTEYSK